jgi:hypothetical protein
MLSAHANTVLDALKAQAETLFGHPATVFEPVATFDRPYSTVLRLRVVTPECTPSYAFVKIYKVRPVLPYFTPPAPADVVREEFAATSRLHDALAGRPGLSSPRPIASFPEHGAIVTQELQGMPLDRALRLWRPGRRAPTLEAVATRIGVWLRAYQRSGGARGIWSPDDTRAYLDDRLRHVARVVGDTARTRALATFDRIAAELPAERESLVPIHADLCPGNIMVTPGGGVAVMDFATEQSGTRYHDIAHLYLHFELARGRARRRGIALGPVQDTLLAAFDRPSALWDPLFRLMLLQHVVCHVTHIADGGGWGPPLALRALARWRWRTFFAMPALASAAPTA